MDALPNELLTHLYSWLPLQSVLRVSLALSRMHRLFGILRLSNAVHALHLTLQSDLLNAVHMDSADHQLPIKCRLTKSPSDSHSLRFVLENQAKHVFVFASCVSIGRVKIVIKEDFYMGCSIIHQTHMSIHDLPQMGVPLTADEGVSPMGALSFLEAHFPPTNRVHQVSTPLVREGKEGISFGHFIIARAMQGFKNKVVLHSWGFDSMPNSNESSTVQQIRDVDDRTVELEWDLYVFSEGATELGGALKSVQIPANALVSSFFKYRPGLSDLDTEDGDSEWMSEDGDSVFDDLAGDGYYDDWQ
ncbi:UNVERIFIED_CONTAM: hypothetical protein HDU68_000458 [Siphonaria sp. JEL0065]|nr:hypothetical protein HDU68_000458 [Siphonaria sp. JEL0065]